VSGLDPVDGARLVERLLRLYPPGWRDRYSEEFAAVLIACLAGGTRRWRLAADVVAGALDARLHRSPQPGGRPMPERIRRSASTAFCAFVVFVLAGSGFAKMSEDRPFTLAARAHPAVGWSFEVVYVGAILAALAVLAGALPVLMAILRQAVAGRRDLRRLLLVPPAALGAWIGVVLLVSRVLAPAGARGPAVAAFLAVVGLGALAAALSTGALLRAARRVSLPGAAARAQWLGMTGLCLAMAAVTGAGLVWGLALRAQSPTLFHSANGLASSPLPATWAATVAVMAATTALAVAATLRAVRIARAGEPVSRPD
jgi:hypothetical protein